MILKPMNVGEILDQIFKLFKGQFKSYLGLAGLGIASILGLGVIVGLLYFLFGQTAALIAGILLAIPFIAASWAMHGGIIKMASEQILGRKMSSMDAFRFGLNKSFYTSLGSIIYSIAVFLGVILLVIPGFYLSTAFIFYAHSIIIDDEGPWSGLQRSRKLTKGCWWRCLGIVFLITMLTGLLSGIPRIAIENLLPIFLRFIHLTSIAAIITPILSISVSFLLAPLSLIGTTLLYYDLRIRKENLDLQVTVDNLTKQNVINPPGE